MNAKTKKIIKVAIEVITVTVVVFFVGLKAYHPKYSNSREFTSEELSLFNGDDPNLPVYLAMDGFVYDVTAGRANFYDPQMPYHYLAGRDASTDLHLAGGGIIKMKYQVIGTLISN